MNKLGKFLGLPGSWRWACRQLNKGKSIRPKFASGAVIYSLSTDRQRRIIWAFSRKKSYQITEWENANIFLSDFEDEWELAQ